MPTSNLTEDVEFLTDVDSRGDVVRRARFIRRPRRVNGRNVPGNARYYRRRQRELLAGRRSAQRAERGGARAAAAGRAARSAGGRAARAPRGAGGAAPTGGERRAGLLTRIRRTVRDAARRVQANRANRRSAANRPPTR
jgi:hypothetical protein